MTTIGAGNGWTGYTSTSIRQVRDDIDEASRRLSSGKVSQSYVGLGHNVSRSLDLRARLANLEIYDDAATIAKTTLGVAGNAINSFSKSLAQIETNSLSFTNPPDSNGRNSTASSLRSQLDLLLSYLNTDDGGTYAFGGRQGSSAPALDATTILDGVPGKAGLKQYIAERQTADLGNNGLGRLSVSNTGTTVSIAQESAALPFGFTLKSISSASGLIPVSGPSGTPPALNVTLTNQPPADSTFSITLGLPDGTTMDVTLKAASTVGDNQFLLGATPADTANNLVTALTTSLSTAAKVQLSSASAAKAAQDFFAGSTTNPPQRIAGPNFATATGFVPGSASDTILWYQGTDDTNDPRNDRYMQIGNGLTIGVGARANEKGFREALASVSLLAATSLSTTDEQIAIKQFNDLRDRARSGLSTAKPDLTASSVSIATNQKSVKTAIDDQAALKSVLNTAIGQIEDAPMEETAVTLTNLQTRLQAMYQLTAKLSSLNLANFL